MTKVSEGSRANASANWGAHARADDLQALGTDVVHQPASCGCARHCPEQRRLVTQHVQVRERGPSVGPRSFGQQAGPDMAATPRPSAVTDNVGRVRLRFTLEVPFSLVFSMSRKCPKAEGLVRLRARCQAAANETGGLGEALRTPT